MAPELNPAQAREFASSVDKEQLRSLCPAKGELRQTCEVEPQQPVTNDGNETCFTISFIPNVMTLNTKSKRICSPIFNDTYKTASEFEPEPEDNKVDAFEMGFKTAVEGILVLPDVTPLMIGEYNQKIMAIYQKHGGDTLDQGSSMEMIRFAQRADTYVGIRKAIDEQPLLRALILKKFHSTYMEMEKEYVEGEIERCRKEGIEPPSVLELKFRFMEAMKPEIEKLVKEANDAAKGTGE